MTGADCMVPTNLRNLGGTGGVGNGKILCGLMEVNGIARMAENQSWLQLSLQFSFD